MDLSFEDAWALIQDGCRWRMDQGVPIRTLASDVENLIVGVEEGRILRRSGQSRSGGDSEVPKSSFERVWAQLASDGRTEGVVADRIVYAILAETLDGLTFSSEPFGLEVTDPLALNLQWGDRDTDRIAAAAGGHVWWVNQGSTYNQERTGGYVWAPMRTKDGKQLGHHAAVSDMRPGEVVVHYANSNIRALGIVTARPELRKRPEGLDTGQWEDDGRYTAVRYFPLTTPIPIGQVPDRDTTAGPFDVNGDVKQGYMYQLTHTFAQHVRATFADRWPAGSPWSSRPHSYWLFQANPNQWNLAENLGEWPIGGDDNWTVTRYREQMQPGDSVVLWQAGPKAGIYAFAELTGTPVEQPKPDFRPGEKSSEYRVPLQLRRVLGTPITREIARGDEVLKGMLVLRQANATNFPLTAQEWARIIALAETPTTAPTMEDDLTSLGKNLHLDPPTALLEYEHLLRDKQQLIFYGPPGTGKTYIAKKFAEFLTKDPSRVVKVQFHASYAYEDFIEGYRPTTHEGVLSYNIVKGPLREVAETAAANPGHVHVLFIDEINRGNLAKIFGELYYLLEYRHDDGIRLQYSRDAFTLPDNLWIIATMNTADRSIALVDAALRRRFHFVPFFPDQPPIQGILRRWLTGNRPTMTHVADLVDAANAKLPDRNLLIGPSHFMRPQLDDAWLERIWQYSILPYVEEQFFGDAEAPTKFTLETVRAELGSGPNASAPEEQASS